ncbi:hypothetical protein CINF_1053 [Candidatus Campylobacter infans]|uniref:Uncharacterized protein n=1 Tax=Candidatus Campylobacter infans TaxID=2561898 RepID=A0A7H9CMV5_9BACT|nr:hypothetical protein [Candidatus Campylobacter infans]QLI05554.1 hypothetical protein CINF_1053 [Candidatus Campylobacter infans]
MIFLIIILMFVPFCVLLAYLYAYVLFGVLNLSKKLSVKISFLVFYAIFILLILYFGFGAELFLAVPVMILSILILKRKQYFINFTKLRLAIASACLLVYAWQLEVPQKIIINMIDVGIEIFNNNYTVLNENDKSNIKLKFENDGYLPNISLFEIYFRKAEVYIYDDINKTINERKIGQIKTAFIAESTLMCFLRNIETGSKCTGFTHGSKYKVNGKKLTILEYIKQHQKGEKK